MKHSQLTATIIRYFWVIPTLYVSYMFGEKIVEGLAHSEEFIAILNVVFASHSVAYALAPVVGIFDFCIGTLLLLNALVIRHTKLQELLFVWTIFWPFIPASLRYFGGVGEFEVVEVLSISLASLLAFVLWSRYFLRSPQTGASPLQ